MIEAIARSIRQQEQDKTKQMRKDKHKTKYTFHAMEIGPSLDAMGAICKCFNQ